MFGQLAMALLPQLLGGSKSMGLPGTSAASTEGIEGGINSVFKDIGSSVTKSVAGGIGERVQNRVAGVPAPGDARGRGQKAKEYNDAAYPGTNPWEQLGGSAGGTADAGAQVSARAKHAEYAHQDSQLEKQLATQITVAEIQAGTSRHVGELPYKQKPELHSKEGIAYGLSQQELIINQTRHRKLIAETDKIIAEKNLTQKKTLIADFESRVLGAMVKDIPALAAARLNEAQLKTVWTTMKAGLDEYDMTEKQKLTTLAALAAGGEISKTVRQILGINITKNNVWNVRSWFGGSSRR